MTLATPPTTTPPGANDGTQPASKFDFRQLWHSILERIWILVLCTVAGVVLATVHLIRTPKLYQSHTVLEIDIQEPTVGGEDGSSRMRTMFLASQEAMRTIEQNLRNRAFLARVVRSERLTEDGGKALLGRSVTDEATPAPATRPSGSATPSSLVVEAPATPLEDALAGALSGMVKPAIRRGTRLIDVFVVHGDPQMAQRLAGAVGREYIRFNVEKRSSTTQESLRYLMEEEERLKERLRASEAAVAEYKANTPDALQLGGGAASTGSQAGAGSSGGRGGFVEDRLQELNNRVSMARSERLKLEGELAQVEQAGQDVEALLAIPGIANSPAVNERRRDVAQLEAAVATLAQRYKDRHPRMMAARAALAEAQGALRREASAAPAVLRNMLEQSRTAESNNEAAANEQEKAAIALNKAAIGYQELARQAETDRALYESVLRQIKQTDLTKGVKSSAITVVERPTLPGAPVSPNPRKSITLGFLGGLAAGLGAIFGLKAIDRSIRTVDQAESVFGLPVLAAIPEAKGATKSRREKSEEVEGSETYRLVADAPEGAAAEAFRSLRATLTLLGPEAERKIFLFTSALPSEGKSFTSANYALSLAQQGYRVLLIDGDLRRPSLHHIFKQTRPVASQNTTMGETVGIVDCLVGATSLEDAIGAIEANQVEVPNERNLAPNRIVTAMGGQLSVLAGGRRAPNPAELLSGPSFAALVAEAGRLFDRVVIDSAPIIAVSDTLLMVPHVQTACLVVRAAKTSRDAVRRAIALLGTHSRPAGIVLNRLPKGTGRGHYYYYSSPGYGEGTYGGHYGDAAKKRSSS